MDISSYLINSIEHASKAWSELSFLVTFLNPIAVNLTNVVSHPCKHGGAQVFYNTNTYKAWTPQLICNYFRFFSTANLIGLILRHNVGMIILDTDTLWTQTATVWEGAMRNPLP